MTYSAHDMAQASADGFRSGVASVTVAPTPELAALSRSLLDAVRAETEYLKSYKLTSPAEAHGAKVFESEVTACADALDAYFATRAAALPQGVVDPEEYLLRDALGQIALALGCEPQIDAMLHQIDFLNGDTQPRARGTPASGPCTTTPQPSPIRQGNPAIPASIRRLVRAVQSEYCSPATEKNEPDDSKVSYPEEKSGITFGMIRLAASDLNALVPSYRVAGWRVTDDTACVLKLFGPGEYHDAETYANQLPAAKIHTLWVGPEMVNGDADISDSTPPPADILIDDVPLSELQEGKEYYASLTPVQKIAHDLRNGTFVGAAPPPAELGEGDGR